MIYTACTASDKHTYFSYYIYTYKRMSLRQKQNEKHMQTKFAKKQKKSETNNYKSIFIQM